MTAIAASDVRGRHALGVAERRARAAARSRPRRRRRRAPRTAPPPCPRRRAAGSWRIAGHTRGRACLDRRARRAPAPPEGGPGARRRPARRRRRARADRARTPTTRTCPRRRAAPLIEVAKRYGVVACVSGRRASDARRIVSLGSIAYLGSHGSEILRPGSISHRDGPRAAGLDPARAELRPRARTPSELRRLRVRLEDKEAIAALHWRGVPDEEEAEAAVREVAEAAEAAGFNAHWGRKVLEIRPPVRIDKGAGIVVAAARHGARGRDLRRRRHHRPRRVPRPARARRAGLAEHGAAGRRALRRDAAGARGGRPT